LRKATKEQKQNEGKRICIEIIQQVKELKGVSGVHVMAYRQEELVAEIIEEAGLIPRPRQAEVNIPDPFKKERKWVRKRKLS
jgi:methylenetetrahydrofolate reductase (NADPH)